MAVPPIIHAEHRVVRELRQAGATAPGAARAVTPTRAIDGRALERLLGTGAVREQGGGRYWLDDAAYGAYRGARRKRVLIVLGVGLLVVLVLSLSGLLRQP